MIISPFVKPGVPNTKSYNHYSLLRSLENLFGLSHLGYAESQIPESLVTTYIISSAHSSYLLGLPR